MSHIRKNVIMKMSMATAGQSTGLSPLSPHLSQLEGQRKQPGLAQHPLPATCTPWRSDFQSQRRDFSI